MLSAVPSVGLAEASECRPQLSDAFAQSDVTLRDNAEVKVSLTGARPFALSLTRGPEVVLHRELNGTCDEASRATVVIVGRWLSTLPRPATISEADRFADAGHTPAPGLRVAATPSTGDAGSAVAREPRLAAAPTTSDAGIAVAREPRITVAPSSSDAGSAVAREPRIAATPSVGDAGSAVAREPRIATAAASSSDAGSAMAREPRIAVALGASDAGTASGRELQVAGALTTSGAGLAPAGEPRDAFAPGAGDAGVVLAREAASVTSLPREGTEGVVARIGVAPPLVSAPVETSRPLRVEVTHLEALAGGGVVTPSTPELVGPAVSLELALHLNERLRIGLLGVFDFGGSTLVLDEANRTRGRLTTRGGLVAPSVQLCFDLPLRLCGGALVGARIAEGQASGTFVFGTSTARAAAFTVGPTAQLAWVVSRFHLALDLSLLVTPTPPTFEVDGLTSLTLPVAQGLFRLSIGIGTVASSGL